MKPISKPIPGGANGSRPHIGRWARIPDEISPAEAAIGLVADPATVPPLQSLLTRVGFAVIADGKDVSALIDACLDRTPQVAVFARDLPRIPWRTELRRLRTELPDCRTVAVAARDHHGLARRALRAGVDGYVLQADVEDTLEATIRAVLAGLVCVPRPIHRQVSSPFTFREKQVLELMGAGLTNQEIGARLFLSESTVKSHLASSFRKLGVCSRAEAAAIVLDPDSGVDLGLAVVRLGARPAALEAEERVASG